MNLAIARFCFEKITYLSEDNLLNGMADIQIYDFENELYVDVEYEFSVEMF